MTMARAYPHLTQSLLPGTVERVRYKQNRLRSIFDRFDAGGRRSGGLAREEVLEMLSVIHTRAGQIMGEPWASASPEAKVCTFAPPVFPICWTISVGCVLNVSCFSCFFDFITLGGLCVSRGMVLKRRTDDICGRV